MVNDVWGLLRRDHDELERLVRVLADPMSPGFEIRSALDGLRIGFAAHADGETSALRAIVDAVQAPPLTFLVSQVVAGHAAQERALIALAASRPGTIDWRDRIWELHDLMHEHDEHQRTTVMPALRDQLPTTQFRALAGTYATERLRALAMMQSAIGGTYMDRLRATSAMLP